MDILAKQQLSRATCTTHASALADESPAAEDDELVAESLRGSTWALELLARRYRGRLHAFALTMLGRSDDAEDVAQETLLRAFAALATYRRRRRFRSWLFRIAANLCRDRLRTRNRSQSVDSETLERVAGCAVAPESEITLRMAVFAAVQRLPLLYREPVVLHYMEALSVAETAEALQRTQTAVRVQLWRARGLLAVELSSWNGEE